MALTIKPEDIIAYFGNVASPFWANYLDNDSVQVYHAYLFETYKSHQEGYTCHCFRCRIFKLLLEVAIGRKKDPSFLLKSEDHAKICFIRTRIRHVVNRDYISFRPRKLVSNQDAGTFKTVSRTINADSYFVLSILVVDNTLFSCKREA